MQLAKLTDLGFDTADVIVRAARGVEGEEGYQPAQYVRVRGFSTDDTMALAACHMGPLATLYQHAVTNGENFDSIAGFVKLASEHAPEVLADVICIATDSRGDDYLKAIEIAKKLPLAIQFEIVEKVARLTFPGDNSVGEFIETVVKMLGGIDGLLKNVKTSVAGSRVSGSKRPS